ncbi:MAG: PqqD family protein [Cyanobacteria bacterium P01_F01_bin.150]
MNFLDEALICASPTQVSADLDGDLAILNFQTDVYHGLDQVGVRVWELLQAPTSFEQVRKTLLSEYDVDMETCDRDLKELLQKLATAGLLEVSQGQAV